MQGQPKPRAHKPEAYCAHCQHQYKNARALRRHTEQRHGKKDA